MMLSQISKFKGNIKLGGQPVIRAMYALTGDPPTNGHTWIINEIDKIADEIHIALAVNPDKKSMFDIEARIEMIHSITRHIGKTICIR